MITVAFSGSNNFPKGSVSFVTRPKEMKIYLYICIYIESSVIFPSFTVIDISITRDT